MPTNTLSAIVLSATWLTNLVETPSAGNKEWYRTNIVSVQTVVAVVGEGVPALVYTNAHRVISTDIRHFEIVETAIASPVVSAVVTAQWPAVVIGPTNGLMPRK